jgi:hypothetical protein
MKIPHKRFAVRAQPKDHAQKNKDKTPPRKDKYTKNTQLILQPLHPIRIKDQKEYY